MALNKVMLIGNLGADPDIRKTQSGDPIANFSIAVTEKWRDKNSGEMKQITEWVKVVCFNKGLSGVIEKYIKKGSKVFVEGKMKTRKWQDQSGTDKYTTEVVIDGFSGGIEMLDGRDSSNSNGSSQNQGGSNNSNQNSSYGNNDDMDDIPF